MPIVSIDAPAGLGLSGKKRLMRRLNAALSDAYGIADNIVFLREYPAENVAIAGVLRSEEREPSGTASPKKIPSLASS